MNKIITILFLGILFTACENTKDDFKYDSKKAKRKFIEKVVEERKHEIYTSYEEEQRILAELEIKIKAGDKKAEKEYEEWSDVILEVTDGAGIQPDIRDLDSGAMKLLRRKVKSEY